MFKKQCENGGYQRACFDGVVLFWSRNQCRTGSLEFERGEGSLACLVNVFSSQ